MEWYLHHHVEGPQRLEQLAENREEGLGEVYSGEIVESRRQSVVQKLHVTLEAIDSQVTVLTPLYGAMGLSWDIQPVLEDNPNVHLVAEPVVSTDGMGTKAGSALTEFRDEVTDLTRCLIIYDDVVDNGRVVLQAIQARANRDNNTPAFDHATSLLEQLSNIHQDTAGITDLKQFYEKVAILAKECNIVMLPLFSKNPELISALVKVAENNDDDWATLTSQLTDPGEAFTFERSEWLMGGAGLSRAGLLDTGISVEALTQQFPTDSLARQFFEQLPAGLNLRFGGTIPALIAYTGDDFVGLVARLIRQLVEESD